MKITFAAQPINNEAMSTVIAFDVQDQRLPTLPKALEKAAQHALARNQKPLKAGVQIDASVGESSVLLIGVNTSQEGDKRKAHWTLANAAIRSAQSEYIDAVQLIALEPSSPEALVDYAYGARLANYQYRVYWHKKAEEQQNPVSKFSIITHDKGLAEQCQAKEKAAAALAEGVYFTRDLVSAPPNMLYPETFAQQLETLSALGIKVEILDVPAMEKLGMGALLGVGQGSDRPPRLVVMQWHNNPAQEKPLAIVGKGVTFDTGGISLKPARNMEEMKMDMAGAGVVAGVMKGLAQQKAPLHVVGVVALAENMPDGQAQRPGDIVTAMNGQTIAVHNTDAEGRLILADALHYTNQRFQPVAMVNLATLTGAIIVALGSEYAGLFCNNDTLAEALSQAGVACDEKLWRMPLHQNYDKQLDTLEADMRNIGGPEAGSITAAQFLQRFVGDTPWAHLDIAGVAWSAKDKPAYPAGASAFGVTLLHDWLHAFGQRDHD